MKSLFRLFLLCMALAPFAAVPAHAQGSGAANYQGIWWNAPAASESGWGINFAHQGDTIFATWFTFGPDGKPLWLVVAANKTAAGVYTGDVYTGTGSPYNRVPYDPSLTAPVQVGTATLTFAGDGSAAFSYTVNGIAQTKNLTRQIFSDPVPTCVWGEAADPAGATNFQDMWWASPPGSESGWGINFAHQGDTIFATWFTFGLDGKPLWLVVAANKTAPNVYAGTLFTGTGPPFNAVPFDPAQVAGTAVGSATFTFADGNNATFAYTVDGVAQSKPITRQVFAPPGTICRTDSGPSGPFSIAVAPTSALLQPGETREVYATVTPRNGFTGSVALSAGNPPAGVSLEFSPATVNVGPDAVSAVLRITASAAAPATATLVNVAVTGVEGAGASAAVALSIGVAAAGDPVATRLAAVAAVEQIVAS